MIMSHAIIIIVLQALWLSSCSDVLDGWGCTLLVTIGPVVIIDIIHWWELMIAYVNECP